MLALPLIVASYYLSSLSPSLHLFLSPPLPRGGTTCVPRHTSITVVSQIVIEYGVVRMSYLLCSLPLSPVSSSVDSVHNTCQWSLQQIRLFCTISRRADRQHALYRYLWFFHRSRNRHNNRDQRKSAQTKEIKRAVVLPETAELVARLQRRIRRDRLASKRAQITAEKRPTGCQLGPQRRAREREARLRAQLNCCLKSCLAKARPIHALHLTSNNYYFQLGLNFLFGTQYNSMQYSSSQQLIALSSKWIYFLN